jgi:uncharacterized membrane protein YtjA (UPF0391 family)
VEIAEKVEDEDDRERNSNQPKEQSAAHGASPERSTGPRNVRRRLRFPLRWRNPRQPAVFLKRRSSFVRAADNHWRLHMGNLLHYALIFLVVALIAAAVGFGGVAGFAMEAARLLFWVFIVLFVISLVAGLVRRA